MGKESPCEEFTGGTFYVLYVNKRNKTNNNGYIQTTSFSLEKWL
jgi:hypothetical protein